MSSAKNDQTTQAAAFEKSTDSNSNEKKRSPESRVATSDVRITRAASEGNSYDNNSMLLLDDNSTSNLHLTGGQPNNLGLLAKIDQTPRAAALKKATKTGSNQKKRSSKSKVATGDVRITRAAAKRNLNINNSKPNK